MPLYCFDELCKPWFHVSRFGAIHGANAIHTKGACHASPCNLFFIVAIVAGIFDFDGSAAALEIARVPSWLFAAIFLLSRLLGLVNQK